MSKNRVRIIVSAVCLVLAIAVAVGTIYAWFVNHDTARTNGVETHITTGDVEVDITVYNASSQDGVTFTATLDATPDKMEDYTPRTDISSGTDTAVLIELKVTYKNAGDYTVVARPEDSSLLYIGGCDNTCKPPAGEDKSTEFHYFTYHNLLSNAVYFRQADKKGEVYDVSAYDQKKFCNLEGLNSKTVKKENQTLLEESAQADEVKTYYFIMDYIPQNINSLYSYMLAQSGDGFENATLNTALTFKKDIVLTIGK